MGSGLPGASAQGSWEREPGLHRAGPCLPQGQLTVWRVWARGVARLLGPWGAQEEASAAGRRGRAGPALGPLGPQACISPCRGGWAAGRRV